ncbi:LOW QUALITY PROTEIN: Hypothetical protein PHPALM_19848 [Phytophthora palmivora]|uniref:Retrovirus-related Pol polyprotein from transposon TNT 1-94-like beta-barrel domain-containing protein n=1 Tax=Phytophthora palmivora TaxID=4796 RepID=A0A2P4XGC3_9STRA|nr:LOW QUALITY PROTEIN: Hypothetical protein PHPALM_19848 [Phytophthora palmivora]
MPQSCLQRLEEIHTEIKASRHVREKRLDNDKTRFARPDPPMTPPMNSSLFVSGLGRERECTSTCSAGRRTHHPRLNRTDQRRCVTTSDINCLDTEPRRRTCIACMPRSSKHIQREAKRRQGTGVFQQQNPQLRYPDARQKKLAIKPFDGRELYVRFGSGFLEWGRRFERQGALAQSACGLASPEDVKVDLLEHYLSGTAEKYYNKQVKAWWAQSPTLQTNITPAQAMKLFPASKDAKRTWPEHYMYLVAISEACGGGADYLVLATIVQYASSDRHTVLMAWELEPSRHKNLGRDIVGTVSERNKEPRRTGIKEADITLPVYEVSHEFGEAWVLDSGSSRHLVNDASWLEAVELCDDQCIQRNGDPLTIRMKGTSVSLHVARYKTGILTDIYFAKNVVHNLISYDQLNRKGYALAYVGERCAMAAKNGGLVTLDVELLRNVLLASGTVTRGPGPQSEVIMAEFNALANDPDMMAGNRLAKDPSPDIEFVDHKRVNYLACVQGKQSKGSPSGIGHGRALAHSSQV